MARKTGSKRRSTKAAPVVADIPRIPGTYVLDIRLSAPVEMTARGLTPASLLPGWYAYSGSARGAGGLAARIRRHLSAEKKPRWHVDALTLSASRIVALAYPGAGKCSLLAELLALPGATVLLPGFGASDCAACPAHLVTLREAPGLDAPARVSVFR